MENNTSLQKYIYFWLAVSLSMVFFIYSHLLEAFPKNAVRWLLNTTNVQLSKFDFHQSYWFDVILIANLAIVGICLDKFSSWLFPALTILLCILGAYFLVHYYSQGSPVFINFSCILLIVSLIIITVMYAKMVMNALPHNKYVIMLTLYIMVALCAVSFSDSLMHSNWVTNMWWQTVLLTCIGSLILAILSAILLRDSGKVSISPTWKDISNALYNPQNWLLATCCGLGFAPLMILATIAGKPFFKQAYQYTNLQVVELGGFLLSSLLIGAPFVGYISNRISHRRSLMMLSILIEQTTFIPLIYLHYVPFWLSATLLFLLGLANSAFILTFVISKEINPSNVIGTVLSLIKLVIITIIVMTIQIFGKFLAWDWDGKIIHGVRCFSIFNFHVAFAIFPIYLLLGFILLFFINDPASSW